MQISSCIFIRCYTSGLNSLTFILKIELFLLFIFSIIVSYFKLGFGGMSAGFGATTQSGSSGLFGKPISTFGTPSTTTTNNFAFNSTPSTNLFGTNTQNKPFGSKYLILQIPLVIFVVANVTLELLYQCR